MNESIRINLKASGDGRSVYTDQPVTFGVPLREGLAETRGRQVARRRHEGVAPGGGGGEDPLFGPCRRQNRHPRSFGQRDRVGRLSTDRHRSDESPAAKVSFPSTLKLTLGIFLRAAY